MTKTQALRDLKEIKSLIERVQNLYPIPHNNTILGVATDANNVASKIDKIIRQARIHWSDEV